MSDESRPDQRGYRDTEVVARLLVAAIVLEALVGASTVVARAMLLSPTLGAVPTELTSLVQFTQIAMIASVSATVLSGAAFVAWVRRIVLNSRSLRTLSVQRSPWSGLWALVPIAWLWMPFLVLIDLWRATHAVRGRERGPRWSGARPRTPPLVLAYWATSVGGSLWACAGPFAAVTTMPTGLSDAMLLAPVGLRLVALFLFFRVVTTITRSQREQRRLDHLTYDEAPPRRGA